ncbi:hypothetical protein P0F40_003411 [Vibrio metschnikovii]|nr:hypothetical protein [Vibrio parahaemolyticus]EKO3722638.1 hypothetical protein [Vibrio metschnikovii]CAH1569573.1 conserved hypothetical protein [Vibrio rotiferianus]EKO3881621.1 hypothetical protein [Vibrio metschnikovii]EKO3940925.1 hypothetical protein [Vibrio metschnikovii]
MDLREIIEESINRLPPSYDRTGIEAAVGHIKRAEKYWYTAKDSHDPEMFTDVIYRTNQAFEGSLKEAYFVLAEKASKKKNPFEIEQYLIENKVLKPKLIEAVRNYRQEWRNTSTHDYKLFFSEHEALLAIANVSTFSVMLLDQIVVKVNENLEKQRTVQLVDSIRASISDYDNLEFHTKVYSVLSRSYASFYSLDSQITMTEYIGKLAGFLEAVIDDVTVHTDVGLAGNTGVNADLLVMSPNEDTVLIEVKQLAKEQQITMRDSNYVLKLLELFDLKHGALMVADSKSKTGGVSVQATIFDETPDIVSIVPTYD